MTNSHRIPEMQKKEKQTKTKNQNKKSPPKPPTTNKKQLTNKKTPHLTIQFVKWNTSDMNICPEQVRPEAGLQVMTCDTTSQFLSPLYFSFAVLLQHTGGCYYFYKTLILSSCSHKLLPKENTRSPSHTTQVHNKSLFLCSLKYLWSPRTGLPCTLILPTAILFPCRTP